MLFNVCLLTKLCQHIAHSEWSAIYFKISQSQRVTKFLHALCSFQESKLLTKTNIYLKMKNENAIFFNFVFFYTDYLYGSKTADDFKLNLAVRLSSFILTDFPSVLFPHSTVWFHNMFHLFLVAFLPWCAFKLRFPSLQCQTSLTLERHTVDSLCTLCPLFQRLFPTWVCFVFDKVCVLLNT